MYEIVAGRSKEEVEKYGLKAAVLLGKHYVKMGQTTSLSNEIYLDVNRSHVVFVCGKRGGGKSYTLGVIAEGMSDLPEEVAENLSIVILDTMGIYWTMKYPNHKDEDLLKQWDMKGKNLDVKIYTPTGYYDKYKKEGIPTDFPFSIRPKELAASEWCMTFEINTNSPPGVLIERIINTMRKEKKDYSVKDIIKEIEKDEHADKNTKDIVINQFLKTEEWRLFDIKGTKLKSIVAPGQVTILDVSCYATMPGTWGIKTMVIGLIAQKLFVQRMVSRKAEEYDSIHKASHYFGTEKKIDEKEKIPLVWLVIDEAHEFLPREGKAASSDALITILREGRQPGISLVLATQQPGKIHSDVITQSDVVISHRLTAKIDVEALSALTQSYMRKGIDSELNLLPRVKGSAVIFDDMNEKVYPMRVRPRFTWHGGEAPIALKMTKKKIEF